MSVDIESAPFEPQDQMWYLKMLEHLKRNRNQVNPELVELPDCDFFNVAPRRTLRVLRPELKNGNFYEAQPSDNRPESLNDNFYLRWAKRPHPSGNCRCSFRQSTNSSRFSTYEEKVISQEIQRIKTSLCEAEKNGKDIQELEKNFILDLKNLQLPIDGKDEIDQSSSKLQSQILMKRHQKLTDEPLEEYVKKKIVKDLDKYISNLLDEILNDTIRAIVQADNPFDNKRKESEAMREESSNFEINFALSDGNEEHKVSEISLKDKVHVKLNREDKGYINQGFVGSASDPDALNFHLRHRLNADVILENVDCIDSGINSVETIELQPEQEQNLEQSLMDIIDAKLGGTSIGKSLEDLGMEIDDTDNSKTTKVKRAVDVEVPNQIVLLTANTLTSEVKTANYKDQSVATKDLTVNSSTSKILDDTLEEPAFNSLRLEFHRNGTSSSEIEEKPSSNVTSKVNKTMFVIRQRIITRLANSRQKSSNNNNSDESNKVNKSSHSLSSNSSTSNISNISSSSSISNSNNTNNASSRAPTRASLELEDYRRRFPVPETNHHRDSNSEEVHTSDDNGDEVTLRNHNRKPMIVFLHGFGSSAEAFEHQLRYFANLGYPCIAPDLLGHGLSSAPNRPRDYHFEKLLKDLETLLLHYAFKPGHKCVLVAHNYGCSFATALACKYTNSVHQLVLISGGGPTPLAPPLSEGLGHCCLRASLAPLLICGMQRAVLYSARGRQHPYCGSELLQEQWPSHMHHVLRGMSWPDGDYIFHRRICTPSLLVHGLRDDKVSLVQECQMERTMIKAFLEAIPSAGHMPMTDCPEQLNHMIHCFIDLWKNKKW